MNVTKVGVFVILAALLTSGCTASGVLAIKKPKGPDQSRVQDAVVSRVGYTHVGGAVRVVGIQENLPANEATAILAFDTFQYRCNDERSIVSKETPDRYQRGVLWYNAMDCKYSGQGTGQLKRFNDGRWVLTAIRFEFFNMPANIPVSD